MNCTCPHCDTVYRVDPAKIPPSGVRARCAVCEGVFPVENPSAEPAIETAGMEAPPSPEPSIAREEPIEASPPPPPAFGRMDPQEKARRLARALVSDIVVYHPERRERAMRDGTLRQEFREEIRKSWEEYVAQVGEQMALSAPYFRDALNEILADGAHVF